MGFSFDVAPADIDETPKRDEGAEAYVGRLARTKAQVGWHAGQLNLGADTIVVKDGALLGKPENRAHCLQMLQQLSGSSHQVFTGVALFDGAETYSVVVTSTVYLRSIGVDEIGQYWETGEPQDKAGAYALQGLGGIFVQRVEGSYSNVIGLPMLETEDLLNQAGFPTWDERRNG
jgi:septum formation protein